MAQRLRVNDKIKGPTVRLVSESGEQLGVIDLAEALASAAEAKLDLVEVAPDADPPVCRLLDYGKHLYKQKKRTHQNKGQSKHHEVQIKELRVRPKTDTHDLGIKIRKARSFLEGRDKVLFNMLFRGREMAYVDRAKELMTTIVAQLEDIAKVEQEPKMHGRRMTMMLTPK